MTITSDLTIRVALTATMVLSGCRESAPPQATAQPAMGAAVAALAAACAPDSLRPVAAAPAAGLWVGERSAPVTRVAALVGPAGSDADRARITRRVEILELRAGDDSIRLASDTASVKLALLPPFASRGRSTLGGVSTEPAAVYAVTPLVLVASYEPCAASLGEPRLRYLRRDERGTVATDLMLRRESADAGRIP